MPNHSGARLTVDLGNTRCKFRLWAESGSLAKSFDLAVDAEFLQQAMAWLKELDGLDRVAMCAVAELELEDQLKEVIVHVVGERFLEDPDVALELDCSQPETIGRDRLFAARGAIERTGRTCIVVDCGTALTVDLVLVADGVATFAGGAIAPGPELLAKALRAGGARLPQVEPVPNAPALGKHTRAALEAGIAVGLRGAARELVSELAKQVPGEALPVVLTGGAAGFLTKGAALADEVVEVPDLVHHGLLAAIDLASKTA